MLKRLPRLDQEALYRIAAKMPFVVLWLLAFLAVPCLAAEATHNVLVLYSDNRLLPGFGLLDEALAARLQSTPEFKAEIFNEFLDLDALRGKDYEDLLVRFMQEKYADTRIDVVIAVRGPALRFLLAHRDKFMTGVPVVHALLGARELASMQIPPDVVGIPIDPQPDRTLELALRVHPGTRRVVVITGTSDLDRSQEAQFRSAFAPFASKVMLEYWSGLPLREILSRIATLPADAIAVLPGLRRDGTGQWLVPQYVAGEVVRASSVPVWGAASNFRESGTIGGYVPLLNEMVLQTTDLALLLLRGERPQALHPPAVIRNAYVLNMFQLNRFGVKESQLPRDAILRFSQASVWDTYRWEISAALTLVLLQAVLIAALLWQRRVRRSAEAELGESNQRMNLAATATGLGMWVQGTSARDSWANPQQRALLGMDATEPFNLERMVAAVHADDRTAVTMALEAAAAKGGEFDVQYRVKGEDGRIRWLVSRGTMELGPDGGIGRVRGVTADATQRIESELEAKCHRDELTHLSRVAMLGQLSGSLAHELNQPLTAILSNAQAAQRFLKADPPDLAEVDEILVDIVANDQRAGDIIRRLRALFERGEAKREAIDPNLKVREVLHLLHSDLVSRNVSVLLELDATLPRVEGDRVQIQQLLLNLVLNSCEAMIATPAGDRRLRVSTRLADPRHVVISVADHGKGIAPDQLERIFEPFVSTKEFGIGLGLVIARTIAEAHGGRLWATSNPEGGATFSFTLPVHATREAVEHDRADVRE